jgi:hypothetical protein
VPGGCAGFAVHVHQRAEAVRFPADDRDHGMTEEELDTLVDAARSRHQLRIA